MLKQSIKRISERMIERADKDILKPMEVSYKENGDPKYFDVIGKRGFAISKKLGSLFRKESLP